MNNPFDNPTTIRDPKDFIGREDQLRRLFGMIEKKQSVALVGAKRIGKTSLLNCLRNPAIQKMYGFAGEKVLFLYFDLQDRLLKTPKDLFEDLHLVLKSQCQEYPLAAFVGEDDEFDFYLEDFQRRGLHPVLILDTFDEIIRYAPIDTMILNYLRGQAMAGQISYITASVDPLGAICRKPLLLDPAISPFFNIFSTIRVRPFSREEARHLLSEYSTREHQPFTEKEIAWVLQMAGHHPYLLQQVGAVLFEEKRAQITGKVNYQRVQQEAYQNLEHHFADCWSMFDEREAEQVRAEIKQGGYEEGNYVELSLSALFREYVHRNMPEKMKKVEEGIVESMLTEGVSVESASAIELNIENFIRILDQERAGDLRVLGESPLIHLPAIAAQVKHRNAQTPVARGLIVRESLKKALEQMRGHGSHRDDEPDWLFYNILHYRYFNISRVTHNLIADRVGMSRSHYYSRRKQAIQALWQILLEMEAEGAVESPLVEEASVENTLTIGLDIENFTRILDQARAGDQRVLGESLLIRLPAIAVQIKDRRAQTPVARGLIVRESLKKALEQMRGHGSHIGGEPDSLFYNILYYRYFTTFRMTHNLIADRLGISTRQYFRTRKQAIQMLWQMLLEMHEEPSKVEGEKRSTTEA